MERRDLIVDTGAHPVPHQLEVHWGSDELRVDSETARRREMDDCASRAERGGHEEKEAWTGEDGGVEG